jgi:hypothetical protein
MDKTLFVRKDRLMDTEEDISGRFPRSWLTPRRRTIFKRLLELKVDVRWVGERSNALRFNMPHSLHISYSSELIFETEQGMCMT